MLRMNKKKSKMGTEGQVVHGLSLTKACSVLDARAATTDSRFMQTSSV